MKYKVVVLRKEKECHIVMLNPRDHRLITGLPFQRDPSEKHIGNMTESWDSRRSGCITLIWWKGEWLVVDGQHRIAAAIAAGEEFLLARALFCRDGEDPEQLAARLFTEISRGTRPLTALDDYKAALVFREPSAVFVHDILGEHGYSVLAEEGGSRTAAFPRALLMWAKVDEDIFKKSVKVCTEIYAGKRLHVNVFKGIAAAAERAVRYDGVKENLYRPENVRKLVKWGADVVERSVKAKSRGEIGNTTKRGPANGILELINYRRPEHSRFYTPYVGKKAEEVVQHEESKSGSDGGDESLQ